MKIFRSAILILILMMLLLVRQWPDEKLHLVFCDVGQGDAALIIKGSFQILVDTGPRNGGVVACLSRHLPFWDRQIEMVVNSHPELDHLGDLGSIARHYRIEQMLVNGKLPKAKLAADLRKVVDAGIKLVVGQDGDRIRYGDLYFDILWPVEKYSDLLAWLSGDDQAVLGEESSLNAYSLVMLLNYGDISVLYTGDISEVEERALVASGKLGRVDILKGAHHGSRFASSADFLAVVRPKITIFSAGKKNRYGHPTAEAIERVLAIGSRVWRTDKQGELELVSDGKAIWSKL